MESPNSLTKKLNHFVQTQKHNLGKAAEAISKADWQSFASVGAQVRESKAFTSMVNLFSTDTTAWNRFEKMYTARNLPCAAVLGAAGGLLLAGAGGSAVITILGVVLILYALSLVFEPLMKKLHSVLDNVGAAALGLT